MSHPALRCGVQRGASCGYCRCRYSLPGYFWIPHQVRNDREGIPGYRVAPGHPAPRCGVQKSASCGYCLCWYSPPGYFWIPHQVRNDVKGISGYRVVACHPAQRCGVQCVSHPAPRCGVQWRESPRTTMRGPERKGEASICRYSWIPHQVRNDVEHRIKCGMTGSTAS